jgi:hypothetical protein
MLDMYGLATVLLHPTRRSQNAWKEDDALVFRPNGPVARGVALIRALAERLKRRSADTCEPGRPVSAC